MIDRFYLTTKGENLLAKAQTGVELKFTRMKVGDGILPNGQSAQSVTEPISPKATFGLADKTVSGNSTVVTIMFTNQGITTGFLWREVWLLAQDPVEGEIYYAFGYDNAAPVKVESASVTAMSFTYGMQTITKNATNITAVIDPSVQFLKRDELARYIAIEGGEVGGTVVTFSDQVTAAIADIASGAKLSVLIGKIKRFIQNTADEFALFRDRASGFATAAQGNKADLALPATGNAVSASKLQTGRTIGIGGKVTAAGALFNGEKDITINATDVDATRFNGRLPDFYGTAEAVGAAQNTANSKASTVTYTATIPATGWSGSAAPYSIATITVTDMLATDNPVVDLVQSGTETTDSVRRENWALITRIVTKANGISVYASEIPTTSIPIQIKVVR